jgi:hypothetical protein
VDIGFGDAVTHGPVDIACRPIRSRPWSPRNSRRWYRSAWQIAA